MINATIPYLSKFKSLQKREDYTFNLLVNSLEYESGVHELLALFEDILTENETNLKQVFKEERDLDVMAISYAELSSLPLQTIKDNASVFQSIFNNALQNRYKERGVKALDNITSLFDEKKACLSIPFLLEKINDDRLDIQYKTKLVRTISEVDDLASTFRWDDHDLARNNFIIPGYMYFYRNSDPAKALNALLCMKGENLESLQNFLYFPIEKVVFSLVIIHKNPEELNIVRQQLELAEIDEIIAEYINTNNQVKLVIEGATEKDLDPVIIYVKRLNTKKSYQSAIMEVLETSYDDDY